MNHVIEQEGQRDGFSIEKGSGDSRKDCEGCPEEPIAKSTRRWCLVSVATIA
jgi:hypothetical protein